MCSKVFTNNIKLKQSQWWHYMDVVFNGVEGVAGTVKYSQCNIEITRVFVEVRYTTVNCKHELWRSAVVKVPRIGIICIELRTKHKCFSGTALVD